MEITPPYYHRHHTLVYIFKKICSEKATFEIFYEVWYENIYLLFLRHNQHPYQYQTHITGWAQGEDIIKKMITPISAFIAKLCPIFETCDDLWPQNSKILDFENWTYLCNGSRYQDGLFLMTSSLLALISYLIVILVGLTCLAVGEKMHMWISTFTKKIHFCTFCTDFFINVFYSALLKIVWEQIFHFQTMLCRKCDWKRDMLRKKCFLMSSQGHPMSIKVIWVY